MDRWDNSGQYLGKTPMTKHDVVYYFRDILWTKKRNPPGTVCDRCGVVTGERYDFDRTYLYKEFDLCASCLKDKVNDLPELSPDIEDLERFKLL